MGDVVDELREAIKGDSLLCLDEEIELYERALAEIERLRKANVELRAELDRALPEKEAEGVN